MPTPIFITPLREQRDDSKPASPVVPVLARIDKRIRFVAILLIGATTLFAAAPKLKIAIVQMAFAPTLEGNRDKIISGITDASSRGARVAVFPEGALNASAGDPTEAVESALEQIRG